MKKCPNCNHKLYGEEGKDRACKFCGYTNKVRGKVVVSKTGTIDENFWMR